MKYVQLCFVVVGLLWIASIFALGVAALVDHYLHQSAVLPRLFEVADTIPLVYLLIGTTSGIMYFLVLKDDL